jgi:MFS family permease
METDDTSSPTAPAGPPVPASLWQLVSFRWFLLSLGAATLASQIQGAAVAYHLYALTHDPLSLGLIGLSEALPFILCALPAGHLADVYDRRRLGGTALVVLAASALSLWALTRWQARLGEGVVRTGAYLILAGTGVCRAFLQPARTALTSMIVPRVLLPAAVKSRAGLWQIMAVTGPAVGGTLYAAFGAAAAYGVAAALLLAAVLAWTRLRVPPAPAGGARPGPMRSSLTEGFRFLRQEPTILAAIALDLFAVLFGGAVALLPIFAEEILRVGPTGFGLLRAAPGVGALATSLALLIVPPFRRSGRAMLASVALFGAFTIAFALSRWFVLSLLLLGASGAADMISVVIRGTLIQVRVPTSMQGRLTAINQIFIGSSNEIGAFESGAAARLLGTVPSVVVGGTITLAVVAVAAWRAPTLRRLGSLD